MIYKTTHLIKTLFFVKYYVVPHWEQTGYATVYGRSKSDCSVYLGVQVYRRLCSNGTIRPSLAAIDILHTSLADRTRRFRQSMAQTWARKSPCFFCVCYRSSKQEEDLSKITTRLSCVIFLWPFIFVFICIVETNELGGKTLVGRGKI